MKTSASFPSSSFHTCFYNICWLIYLHENQILSTNETQRSATSSCCLRCLCCSCCCSGGGGSDAQTGQDVVDLLLDDPLDHSQHQVLNQAPVLLHIGLLLCWYRTGHDKTEEENGKYDNSDHTGKWIWNYDNKFIFFFGFILHNIIFKCETSSFQLCSLSVNKSCLVMLSLLKYILCDKGRISI